MEDATFSLFVQMKRCPACHKDIVANDYKGVRWFFLQGQTFMYPICDRCLKADQFDMVDIFDRVNGFIETGELLEEIRSENEAEIKGQRSASKVK